MARSRLKIEHGVSRIKRAKLPTYIDQTIAEDIDLVAESTDNEQHYIVNELLRYALAQPEAFQNFKTEHAARSPRTPTKDMPRPVASTSARNPITPASKSAAEPPAKSGTPVTVTTSRT